MSEYRVVVCEACHKRAEHYYSHRESWLCSVCRDSDLSYTPYMYWGISV